MNKLSNEAKIGLIVLAAFLIAFFGFRIMKDEPLFSSTNLLYTKYDTVNGLLKGGTVTMRGLKIGTVKELVYLPEEDSVLVTLNITTDLRVSVGSKAELVTPNVLGSPTISIIRANNADLVEWGGFIEGTRQGSLLDSFSGKGSSITDSVATTLQLTNEMLRSVVALQENSSNDISGTISNFRETSESLKSLINNRKSEVDSMIVDARNTMKNISEISDSSKQDVQSLISNLDEFSTSLEALSIELQASSESINSILTKIDIGEGSLGKMVNDPSLYNNMDSLTVNLNELIKGIQQDPKRYLKHMRLVDIF